jgi:hypothetical protein
MTKYDPFFEKAGMRKTAESQRVKGAFRMAELLKKLGFNITFLRSQKYVLNKLSDLDSQESSRLKTAFSGNTHPRFMKEFSFHAFYGRSRFYTDALQTANLGKITKLVSVCAMVLQVKVYRFWSYYAL